MIPKQTFIPHHCSKDLAGSNIYRGSSDTILILRFNQNAIFFFIIIVLSKEWSDNQGIQKFKKLLNMGTAAMFICTERKEETGFLGQRTALEEQV